MSAVEFFIPGEAPSTPNLREHWGVKAKRTKATRAKALLKAPHWQGGPLLLVTLTRVGVRFLDSDNLAAALKAHRDGIAARLRVDDGSPLIEFRYRQEKAAEKRAEGVRVRWEPLRPSDAGKTAGRAVSGDVAGSGEGVGK